MKKLERNTEKAIQDKAEKELGGVSIKPKINSNSRKMAIKETDKYEDQLINYGKSIQEKIAEKRMEQEEEQKSTFKPEISIMSQKIMAQKSLAKPFDPYESLYEDAMKRKEKEKVPIASVCTFTPELTPFKAELYKNIEKPKRKPLAE